MTSMSANREARDIIEALHGRLQDAVDEAIAKLGENGDTDEAVRLGAAMLLAEAARVLAAAADQGRATDSRTFEAMFDVNAASNHFQAALAQGIRHAAEGIRKDGYSPSCALVLAGSRAMDAVADILRAG